MSFRRFRAAALGLWVVSAWSSLVRAEASAEVGADVGAEPKTDVGAERETKAEAEASDDESGPEAAARTGYATALGRFQRGERIRSALAGAVPMWVDVGYRIDAKWFVGAYGQYALGIASETSDARCPSCQHSWIRWGLQAQRRWVLNPKHALWVGLGVGQQFVNTSISGVISRSRSTRGWELMNAQFGVELQPTRGLAIGPYFSGSLGTFVERSERCTSQDTCPSSERQVQIELEDPSVHAWLNLGLRIVLQP